MKSPFLTLMTIVVLAPSIALANPISSSNVASLIHGTDNRKSNWAGDVYDVFAGEYRKSSINVTFKPSTATSGTWTSAPFDLFAPTELFEGVGPQGATGTWTGTYHIVGDLMLVSDIINPNNATLAVGRTSVVAAKGNQIQFIETAALPSTVVLLHKK